jgi:hypothetical protein
MIDPDVQDVQWEVRRMTDQQVRWLFSDLGGSEEDLV